MSTAGSSVSAVLEVDNEALNGESYYLSWGVSAVMVPTPLSIFDNFFVFLNLRFLKRAKGVKSSGLIIILFEVV